MTVNAIPGAVRVVLLCRDTADVTSPPNGDGGRANDFAPAEAE
jgi:hypothetical protein